MGPYDRNSKQQQRAPLTTTSKGTIFVIMGWEMEKMKHHQVSTIKKFKLEDQILGFPRKNLEWISKHHQDPLVIIPTS